MTPQEIFDKFADHIFQLSSLQRSTRRLIDGQINELARRKAEGGSHLSVEAFHYYNAADGLPRSRRPRKADIDQVIYKYRFQKIKQYQWLLAEAYEAFEDFLEESYAAGAMRTGRLWWLSDYGNVGPEEVDENNFNWLRERARKKTQYGITDRLRNVSLRFKELEVENSREVNYRVVIVLIEKLRHVIVHDNGYLCDLDAIIKKSLGQCGKDQRYKDSLTSTFQSYLELHEGRQIVSLLEFNLISNDAPPGAYQDTLGHLFTALVSYAELVKETIEELAHK